MSWFQLKDRIDGLLFDSFNLASDAFFFFQLRQRWELKRNIRYENRYHGKRCVILGTGPSLNRLAATQLALLTQQTLFAVNFFYKAKVAAALRPQFYVLVDSKFRDALSGVFADVCDRYKNAEPVIITDVRAEKFIPKNTSQILIRARHYPVRNIRSNLAGNISITGNVVGSAILAAIYMGFKQIVLIGCDYNAFCSPQLAHCYTEKNADLGLPSYNLGFHLREYTLTTQIHYLIARHAEQKRVQIFNATEGSLLDAYPRVGLAEVLR